jgi:hypothetical protein
MGIMKHKLLIGLLALLLGYGIWTQTYTWRPNRAIAHLDRCALSRSHTCCAWFVMRAMQSGGCPIGILPAWAYRYALPLYGFHRVQTTDYKKGDICVFPAPGGKHIWGHIAMWDGKQWVSDFKQQDIVPGRAYEHLPYRIYRYGKY